MYRHGDLLIVRCGRKNGLKTVKDNIVEEGEATGHYHRIQGDGGTVLIDEQEKTKYIEIQGDELVEITHEEHEAITIPPGFYRVVRQREYNPYEAAVRYVQD